MWIELLKDNITLDLKRNNFELVEEHLQLINELNPKIDNQIDYYKLKGHFELKINQFNAAKINYDKCIKLINTYYSKFHYEKAEIYHEIADYWFTEGDYEQALTYNSEIFQSLLKNELDPLAIDKLRPIEFIDGRKALEATKQRSLILAKQGEYESFKKMAWYSTKLYDNVISQNISSQDSKYFLRANSQEYFSSIIEYAIENDDTNFAFSISQFAHNLILRLQNQTHEAEINSGVPDSLLKKSNDIKLNIFKTKSQIVSTKSQDKKDYNSDLVQLDLAHLSKILNITLSLILIL